MTKKMGQAYNAIEKNILLLSLTTMVIVAFTQVVMRYVFNNSLSWSEEFLRYLFIWFSWIGVSAGLKDNEHLRVELLSTSFIKRGFLKSNEILQIIVSLIWLATTLIVVYYGYQVVSSQMNLKVVTPAMRIPVWIGYLSVPVCSLIVGIRLITDILGCVKKIFGKSDNKSEVTI